MENKEILEQLQKDLIYFNDQLLEVSTEILNSGFSKFPVFIAHQQEIQLGELILDKSDFSRNWSFSATTMEELIEINIIASNKKQDFKNVYKDPKMFMCIFMVTETSGNFIFFPYKKKGK